MESKIGDVMNYELISTFAANVSSHIGNGGLKLICKYKLTHETIIQSPYLNTVTVFINTVS